jgi:hypothetical protein
MAHYYKPWFFDMKVKGSEFIKTAEILIASPSTHSSSQPGGISQGQTTSPENND